MGCSASSLKADSLGGAGEWQAVASRFFCLCGDIFQTELFILKSPSTRPSCFHAVANPTEL